MRRVLIVSADSSLIETLASELYEYVPEVAGSVVEAFGKFQDGDSYRAIVADYDLPIPEDAIAGPEQHGTSLLMLARDLLPGTVRILLHPPTPAIAAAVVEMGFAHATFTRPWPPGTVAHAIRQPRRDLTPVTKS